jgi:hypothetical protein
VSINCEVFRDDVHLLATGVAKGKLEGEAEFVS